MWSKTPKGRTARWLNEGKKEEKSLLCNIQQPERHLLFMQNNKETIKNRLEFGIAGRFIWIFKPGEGPWCTFAELQRFSDCGGGSAAGEAQSSECDEEQEEVVKQRCILAAVREEGAGLGGVIKAGGRRGGDKRESWCVQLGSGQTWDEGHAGRRRGRRRRVEVRSKCRV